MDIQEVRKIKKEAEAKIQSIITTLSGELNIDIEKATVFKRDIPGDNGREYVCIIELNAHLRPQILDGLYRE